MMIRSIAYLAISCCLTFKSYAQVGVLVNPYDDYTGGPSPTYINASNQLLQTVHNLTTVPGFTGEYEINLDFHQWKYFSNDHVISYDFEVVGFPFTMDCAFQALSCANCQMTDRKLYLPHSSYDNIAHTWGQYLYNDMLSYGKGEFTNPGNNSVLANGHHQTLVTDFFNQSSFPTNPNRIYFPHTALKLNLYLHCNINYINPGPIISKISYIYDNTRGRMRFYPFKVDNCAGSAESNYDIIFRPTSVNSLYPIVMDYDDNIQTNASWTEGNGTPNYYRVSEIDINGCTSVSVPPIGSIYWDHDIQTMTSFYGAYPFPGPYSLQTCYPFGSEAKSLAGYENQIDPLGLLIKNEGIEHQYNIDSEFDLNIINSNQKIIYNPSKVVLSPTFPQTYFDLHFPEYYTFKTLRGTIPTIDQVEDDNLPENGGPLAPDLVPVRTDLRSEDSSEPHDENNIRHSVFSSMYILQEGSQITIDPCVSLFDLCFEVNPGANLVISDYSQIRGKEDMSVNPTGRFKIRGNGGAVLRNNSEVQYVQNGNIYQSTELHYIATDRIISGYDVSDDLDQVDGNFEVKSGANVIFEAGNYIHLTDGFYVSGGDFHAVINENLPVPAICFANNGQNGGNRVQQQANTFQSGNSNFISVSPNPNQGYFTIYINGINSMKSVSLFDLTGRSIYHKNDLNEKSLEVRLAPNIKGLIVAKIIDDNGEIKMLKVVIE